MSTTEPTVRRFTAALEDEARELREEAARFRAGNRLGHRVRVDPGKGQGDPGVYADTCLVVAGALESVAARIKGETAS
jgi:hypothetical protein